MRPIRGIRADRLRLATFVEAGDPRLRDALADHEPGEVLEAIRAGRPLTGVGPWPEEWRARVHDADRAAERAWARAAAAGLQWVTPGDARWPSQLDDLQHLEPIAGATGAPVGLWFRGAARLDLARSVSIVGARDSTTYGNAIASELAADLADAGVVVISGAAFGIDSAAHRGALALTRPTVAVLACGADVDYPRAHQALLERIADDGLVLSEQLPGQPPLKSRFLARNRLIAALSLGTVVVEAARRSGSLNTLHWADQLGRHTMGVPGPVTHRTSAGVHQAIRNGKAILVTAAGEVHEALDPRATSV